MTWEAENLAVTPGNGCPDCGHAPPADIDAAGTAALIYEWQHEIRPVELSTP